MRERLWFLPSVFIAFSILLGICVTWIDEWYADVEFYQNLDFLYRSGADNSLAILTTIAASVMTVASVSFSITIVSLTLASSQFGPRLLRNFMRSFVTQSIIGTFTGTFVYCLIAMRNVGTSWEEGSPHLSVTVGVGLAILCVWLLILFVHHVAASIQADTLVSGVHGELESQIEALPKGSDPGDRLTNQAARERCSSAIAVRSPRSGYLLAIDGAKLSEWAQSKECTVVFAARPGAFIAKGDELAWLEGIEADADAEDLGKKVLEHVFMGRKRSPEQDIEYTVSQLVEIAVRALSPGINDPKTAEVCIDYLVAALCQLANRQLPNISLSREGEDRPCLLVPSTNFAGIVDEAFNRVRQSFGSQPSVIIRMISGCTRIARRLHGDEVRRNALLSQIRQIEQVLPELGLADKDRSDIEERLRLFHAP